MQDEQIIALYFERDETAIKETEHKYGGYCMSIAQNILHNVHDSQECVNDTYMRMWKSIPPYKPECLRAFIGKITRRLALNMYEKASAQKRGKGTVQLVLDELDECIPDNNGDFTQGFAITDALNSFLASLSEQNRNIFVRRYWYMSTIKDIASDYSISESKVKMRLMRMRNELRVQLEEEGINI
ncbi:MAG: RNA polymerase sigma factor [Clostridia bacterium]|nr:RNA polymerase sigma factor [Clostridia bacterium]